MMNGRVNEPPQSHVVSSREFYQAKNKQHMFSETAKARQGAEIWKQQQQQQASQTLERIPSSSSSPNVPYNRDYPGAHGSLKKGGLKNGSTGNTWSEKRKEEVGALTAVGFQGEKGKKMEMSSGLEKRERKDSEDSGREEQPKLQTDNPNSDEWANRVQANVPMEVTDMDSQRFSPEKLATTSGKTARDRKRNRGNNSKRMQPQAEPQVNQDVLPLGLTNNTGQNNCFLNVVVQSLWHLDAFREGFCGSGEGKESSPTEKSVTEEGKGSKEGVAEVLGGESGQNLEAALRKVFERLAGLETLSSLPSGMKEVSVDVLREALSEVAKQHSRFRVGNMDDAVEAYEGILGYLLQGKTD